MRINRLDLTRYGIFTDYSIPFGERDGVSDLHVVYGPNEAGKSTALSAILDLIFGIESRNSYNFLHPYSTMRIGGDIEVNGRSSQFARIKKPQNSLLDGAGKPISEGIILGDLGGIDRSSYTTMFSLDDDTMEAGGENILASRGDLGQLLFSASAGLSDLSQKLLELKEEADTFYKYRGRGGELSELKTQLDELKKKRESIDTIASEYANLMEVRDRTQGQYNHANAERGRIRNRLNELQRQLGAQPRLLALRKYRELISPIAHIPEAPLRWINELPQLKKSEIEIAVRAKGLEEEIGKISEELDQIVVDERILEFSERIDRQADLRARYVTADKDLPERRLEQRDIDTAIAGILARIELDQDTDPDSVLLGASTVGALRDLIEQKSGIDIGLSTAKEELEDARQRLFNAESKLKGMNGEAVPGNAALHSQLAAAIAVARVDDHATRIRLARREHSELLEVLSERMRGLHPWTGEAKALRDLFVPSDADIEHEKRAISEVQKKVDHYLAEIERLSTEQRRLSSEIEVANKIGGILSDQQVADIRVAREEAWATHKRTLEITSANAFESILRKDDIATGNRIGNATEVANLYQLGRALAAVNVDLDAAQGSCQKATEDLQEIHTRISAMVQSVEPSLPKSWSLSKLESWISAKAKVIETLMASEKVEREEREAVLDGESIRKKLMDVATAAAGDFPTDASVETLVFAIQEAIDRETELKALRSESGERRNDVSDRERKAGIAEKAKQVWDQAWASLCKNCWLGKDGSVPTVFATREILIAIEQLVPLMERRTSLSDRIQHMERDQLAFVDEVQSVAGILGFEIALAPLDLAAKISRALETSRAAYKAREAALTRKRSAAERSRGLGEEKELNNQAKSGMIKHFLVESLDEVDEMLRNLQRRSDLEEQATAAEQEILNALGAQSISLAEDVLDKLDRSAAEVEAAELTGVFEDQDKRSHELFSDLSKILGRIEAVGGDDAAARIEEQRRTTLLEIEDRAKSYLRLRLGVAAAEQALRIFREEHRSTMMARASEAFKIISRGAYKGLATQPDKDNEILVVVQANDSSKIAPALSKGTRFQLYLALRVAGYQEFAQSRPSVPFIADDIMETFDDFRAEETFRLFVEMAKVGQVIYFTHHQHLCEIAKRVYPAVRVHNLRDAA